MRRIALLSLAHDRAKLISSLVGVAFAATLVLVELGLYQGFVAASSALIRRVGGDVWVMARGTEVLDHGYALSAGSRAVVADHPCVRGVRGLVLSFAPLRQQAGTQGSVLVIGFDPRSRPLLPWNLRSGLPGDLHAPSRISVDLYDLKKLRLPRDPIGATLDVGDQPVYVAALTQGIRSFTLQAYLFAELPTARRLVRMSDDQATYWIADLADRSCQDELLRYVERHPDLQARTQAQFARMTEAYWVGGSGAGSALGFGALFGLIVGAIIVGQTLYSITRAHLRELATLKALGATRGELASFVLWQTAVLAVVGGAVGSLLALLVEQIITRAGLNILVSSQVFLYGLGGVLLMCGAASATSIRAVLKVEAAMVFK